MLCRISAGTRRNAPSDAGAAVRADNMLITGQDAKEKQSLFSKDRRHKEAYKYKYRAVLVRYR